MSTNAEDRTAPSELVANFLSVISIVASLLALFWDPLRLSPLAVLLALIATGMGPKNARLPLVAVVVGALGFIVGVTIAVTTNHPIY